MFNNFMKIGALTGLVLFAPKTQAQIDQTVPTMNPASHCLVNGSDSIEGIRDYSFLTSDDCKTIFVRPEQIGRQYIDYNVVGNLDVCKAISLVDDRNYMLEAEHNRLTGELIRISKQKATTEWSIAKKKRELEQVRSEIAWVKQELATLQKDKDENYGNLRGARFSILSDNRVIEDDLVKIAKNNYYNVVVNGEIYEKKPKVTKAAIVDSFYTFFIRKPSTRDFSETIIETDSPAKLHSDSKRVGIVHVESGDLLPAEMILNMPVVCLGAIKNDQGTWELTNNYRNPMFTVKRTYTINQRVAFGYQSTLRMDPVLKQMVNYLTINKMEPFTLDDVFLKVAQHDTDSILEFFWDQQMGAGGQNISPAREKNIKLELLAGYLNNYFEKLVKDGVLEIVGMRDQGSKEGSFVTNNNADLKCYQSPLSKNCYTEVYQIKDWDGELDDELHKKLHVNQVYSSSVGVNHLEPYDFTSLFVPHFQNQNQ